jgi:peptidyl-prolyl cis-trans isomerase D
MLQSINDKAKGILGWIIIAFISVPFALWGIQEYIGGAPERFAAKVNDHEVSIRDFEQALARERQRLESMFSGNLPTDETFVKRMKERVLDQLVARNVLEQRVIGEGYRISNKMLAQKIQTMEPFQQDGKFISASYEQILNSQGMSVAQFEYLYRRDLIVQQLQDGVTKTSIVGQSTLEQLNKLQQQTRDISYLLYKQSTYATGISVTEEEVQQYYDENKDRYMHPEQASISYVELKSEDLDVDVPVDEEALRRQYDEYVASLADKEERKARHILVQLSDSADEATKTEKKQKIEAALNELKSGASFEKLAKSLSEDPGSAAKGGDLSWVAKGMMVPAFEEALFKLKKGAISEVVKSSFGYHIIKLEDIKGSEAESFASKKEALLKELKQEEATNLFYERSEIMATLAYENDDTLQSVADNMGLKIQQSKLFSHVAGQGIASDKKVRDAAFNSSVLKERRNSDVIELSKNHILVLRLEDHKEAKPKALDEVKAIVEISLKSSKAKQQTQAAGLQALADLQKGKSMDELAKDEHAEVKNLGSVKRDHAGADAEVVRAAFRMAKPAGNKSYKTVELHNGIAVVSINSINELSTEAKGEDLLAIQKQLETTVANQEISAVLEYLEAQSEIIKSKEL